MDISTSVAKSIIRKFPALLAVAFIFGSALAQPKFDALDSLEILLDAAVTDEDRIDTYLGISRVNMLGTNKMQEAFDMAQKAYDLAIHIGSERYEADAICFIGMTKRGLLEPYAHHFKDAMEVALASGDPNSILFAAYLHTEYYIKQPKKGIGFLKSLIEEHKKDAWNKTVGNAYKVLAWQYEQNGDYLDAEEANLTAIDYFIDVGENPPIDKDLGRPSSMLMDKGEGNLRQVYVYISELYSKMGRFDDAIRTAKMGYQSAQEGNSEADLFWTMMRLGGIYQDMGQYQSAIELYTDALEKIRDLYSPQSAADIYLALGEVYSDIGELDEAEKRYLLAYDLGIRASSHAGDILMSLADVNYKQADYLSAATYFIQADSFFLSMDNDNKRIESQLGLAKTQIANGLYETADVSLKGGLTLAKELNNDRVVFDIYMTMSDAEEGRGHIDGALESALQAYVIAQKRAEELELFRVSHNRLAQLYERQGDYKKSLFHQKKYQVYNDSLFSEMTIQKLKQEQVSQNVIEYIEEKDSAQQLAAALKSQNTLYILISSLLGLFLLGGSYLMFQLRKSRLQVEEQNLELNELNATKDRFFGIIAHDIRSPIAALQSVDGQMNHYAKKGDTNKLIQLSGMVGGTAKRLNNLLDNLLNWAMLQTKTIPYHPEEVRLFEIVKEASELFLTNATDKKIKIKIEVDTALSIVADRNAIQTIVRNLLSNALKFSPEKSEVRIEAIKDEGHVLISIIDQGVGMTSQQLESIYEIGKKSSSGTKGEAGTGLGLVLVKELVEYNKGEIRIESVIGQGTSIIVKMPKS